MNLYDKIIDDYTREAVKIAKEEIKPLEDFFETFAEYVVSTKAVIKAFKETGVVDFDDISWEKFQQKKESAASAGPQEEKSADVPIIAEIKQEAHGTRQTRRTAKNAAKSTFPIVKLEKIDEATTMPAPTKRALRKKKVIKQEKDEDVPDVAIVEEPIPIIELDDSAEENTRKTTSKSKPDNVLATSENKSDEQETENTDEDVVNATFVANTVAGVSQLMTEDESEGEAAAALPVASTRPKQLFSPVKAKVQQFEKMHVAATATRTVTRSQLKDKVLTPTFSRSVPKATSTALKATAIESLKRKQEREESARNNRDKRLLETVEKNKRIREEKQLKAQQQREAIEKEKMTKLQEQQRAKEEQERKKRHLDTKERGDDKRKKLNDKPLYLLYKPPRLPTDDCYDSDEEEAETAANTTRVIPNWVNKSEIRAALRTQFLVGHQIKNTFFSIQAESPDLQEILEVVDSKKLVRHSSAVWTRPPRFTMFPVLEKEGGYDNYYADN